MRFDELRYCTVRYRNVPLVTIVCHEVKSKVRYLVGCPLLSLSPTSKALCDLYRNHLFYTTQPTRPSVVVIMSRSPRVVLITGANSGVGFAATKVLVTATTDDHFHVIMTGRSLEKVLAAKKEISSSNPDTASRLSAICLDVTDSSSVQAAAEQVSSTWGRLDALINNAAVGNIQSPDVGVRLQKCLETNVIGAAVVADTFRPLLLKSASKPYSIFVSSGAGSVSVSLFSLQMAIPHAPCCVEAFFYC
jgi:hypothetical protein